MGSRHDRSLRLAGRSSDAAIIEAARCGVYNFHPTDLAKGIGAGPTPYEEVVGRGDPGAGGPCTG